MQCLFVHISHSVIKTCTFQKMDVALFCQFATQGVLLTVVRKLKMHLKHLCFVDENDFDAF